MGSLVGREVVVVFDDGGENNVVAGAVCPMTASHIERASVIAVSAAAKEIVDVGKSLSSAKRIAVISLRSWSPSSSESLP